MVEQVDREAARILALSLFDGDANPERIARAWSESFAAHRLAAEKAERERIADWIDDGKGPYVEGYGSEIAAAIRAGEYER